MVLFVLGTFLTVLWFKTLYWKDGNIWAGWGNIWADWAAHITYAKPFAFGDLNSALSNHPLFINKKFSYPFLIDAISGLLIRLGLDIVSAFILPSIIFTILFLIVYYKFVFHVTKSAFAGITAISMFLFSGGLGFYYYIKDDLLMGEKYPSKGYTNIVSTNARWNNTITDQLFPQRSMLLGFVTGIFIIYCLEIFRTSKEKIDRKKLFMLGLLSGLLPLIHMHSFIVLFIYCIVSFIFSFRKIKDWIIYALGTGIVASAIYYFFYYGEVNKSFFKIVWGWMSEGMGTNVEYNFFTFWIFSWGVFLILALAGTIFLKFYKNPLVITAWIAFAIANIVVFQPYDWDNSKILIWSYLLLTIPAGAVIYRIWKINSYTKIIAILILFFACFSGLIDSTKLLNSKKNSFQIYNN